MATIHLAWYNLENLYEPGQHPELKNSWTQARYEEKTRNLAKVIASLHEGRGPDLLGVCEVASDSVIRDLITRLPNPADYDVVHADSPDPRLIDVGFMFRKSTLSVIETEVHNIRKRYPTRDILGVVFRTVGNQRLIVIGNHWPSRSSGQYKTEPYRIMLAENCAWVVDKKYKEDPNANILVMGDFNDEPFDRSVQEYLFGIRNRRRVSSRRGGKTARPYLYNLSWALMDKDMPGTYFFSANPAGWNMLDQMMVSKALLTGKSGLRVDEQSISIFRPDWIRDGSRPKPYRKRDSAWICGYSDHFPITATLNTE